MDSCLHLSLVTDTYRLQALDAAAAHYLSQTLRIAALSSLQLASTRTAAVEGCKEYSWIDRVTTSSMRHIVQLMLLRHASSVAVRNALQNAVATLHKARVPEAQASAEWLLAHALGESDRSSVQTAIATKRDLDSKQQAQFSAFVERRLQREPVQYIVGKWAFHDVELELAPPTLIPR